MINIRSQKWVDIVGIWQRHKGVCVGAVLDGKEGVFFGSDFKGASGADGGGPFGEEFAGGGGELKDASGADAGDAVCAEEDAVFGGKDVGAVGRDGADLCARLLVVGKNKAVGVGIHFKESELWLVRDSRDRARRRVCVIIDE